MKIGRLEVNVHNLTDSGLIDLSKQQGGMKISLEELNNRRQLVILGKMPSVDFVSRARMYEGIMAAVGRKEVKRIPKDLW